MKKVLLASAAVMMMAGTGYAAEPLLEPLPPTTPTVVEPFVVPTWAGPYVGADIGWGWADSGDDDHHGFFNGKDGFFDGKDGFFNGKGDDDELSGPVGGVFAGWLGQSGTFLYGVELFAQIAEIDGDDDDGDRHRRNFDGIFDGNDDFFVDDGRCFFDADTTDGTAAVVVDCPGIFAGGNAQVHALFGLEGMIGFGGERAAFLLHAGPALGWFQDDDEGHRRNVNSGDADFDAFVNNRAVFGDDDDQIELGVSLAAEGRFKLTERVFAGVIGRAFWFPDVGDDDDDGRRRFDGVFRDNHDDDDDVTVFEVKARLGMMFGHPAVAAPVEVAY